VLRYIADPELPMYSEAAVRQDPVVRIEYEQAITIGGVGECLAATRSKYWGDGPWITPLQADDWFYPHRITYVYRENSLYNRRFEQRRQLKELLGKRYRKLVGTAKWHTKTVFLRQLTDDQADAVRRILSIEPGIFWRACQGRAFLDLPPRMVQLEFDFGED